MFSRSVSQVSDSLVMMGGLKSAYAEAFDHRDVNMVNGISLGIILGNMVESATEDQHLLSLWQALELLLEGGWSAGLFDQSSSTRLWCLGKVEKAALITCKACRGWGFHINCLEGEGTSCSPAWWLQGWNPTTSPETFVSEQNHRRPSVGECLLLCRVMAVVTRNVFLFGSGWEAIRLLPACYIVVYIYLILSEVQKQDLELKAASCKEPPCCCRHLKSVSVFFQLLALRPCGT